jgi:sugar fermentation stimulation protein A
MLFDPPLLRARLISRYKRFLFDAELENGRIITGFCPNTGSMRGLTAPGSTIWLSEHDSPTRKYRHVFELIEADGTLVGVNTAMPNRLAEEAILAGRIGSLRGYADLRREQKYGRNSRIDFLLTDPDRPTTYVEVKNVHFSREAGLAEFPDTETARGAKHLEELGDMVEQGHRAVMLYVVQRDGCKRLRICRDLDPRYGAAYARARQRGVEALAVGCHISPIEITAAGLIPMDEPGIAALQTKTTILD